MTREEQFKNFGCACRCLIALANLKGNPISKIQFINEYSKKYPFWGTQCGITDLGMILDIARELKISNSVQIFINKNKVREVIEECQAALLMTEKIPDENGKYSDFFHCNLVDPRKKHKTNGDSCFFVHQINDDIKILPPDEWDDVEIDRRVGYFLLFH